MFCAAKRSHEPALTYYELNSLEQHEFRNVVGEMTVMLFRPRCDRNLSTNLLTEINLTNMKFRARIKSIIHKSGMKLLEGSLKLTAF